MTLFDILGGRIKKINMISNQVGKEFLDRLENVNPSPMPIMERSYEERLIWLSMGYVAEVEYLLFHPEMKLFLKHAKNITEKEFYKLFIILVLYFLYTFYESDSYFEDNRYLKNIINQGKLIFFLNSIFNLRDDEYKKFIKNLSDLGMGNDVNKVYSLICESLNIDENGIFQRVDVFKCLKEAFKEPVEKQGLYFKR